MSLLLLTAHEARVLASLVEKSITTPAYYPMTVNGLMAAANQKSSRNPLMSLSEGEVGQALIALEEKNLVARDDLSSRATKWRQKLQHQLLLKKETLAVLSALLLRAAQTPAELRANAAGMGGPAELEGVMAALADLADRAEPLVVQLPRGAGQSAARWAHRLCGEPAASTEVDEPAAPSSARAGLEARVAALEARIAELEARLAAVGG